jgi:hypothetical protein
MDIVGPLSRTKAGNKFILTIVDDATRFPEAYALKEQLFDTILSHCLRMSIFS